MDVTSPLRRRMAGVTLLELLVGSAVALLLTALAVPAVHAFIGIQETASAANAISRHLALARLSAVTGSTRVVLCPSTDGATCTGGYDWSHGWLVFRDLNDNRQHDADERRLAVAAPLSGRARMFTSSGRRQVVYRSDGSTGGTNATFRICNAARPERRRAVIVNVTGRVKVSDRDASGRPIDCSGFMPPG